MEGIPVKIVQKKQMEDFNSNCGRSEMNEGYGVIGCKKTGKLVAKFKINNKTGEKQLIYKDKTDKLIMKLEKEGKI